MVLGLRTPKVFRRKKQKDPNGEMTPKPAEAPEPAEDNEPKTPAPEVEIKQPAPAAPMPSRMAFPWSWLVNNLKDLALQAAVLTALSILSTLLVSLIPEVAESLSTLLASLDSTIFVLHVVYHAVSHRKEADSYPTGLIRKLLVPLIAAMSGGIVHAAVFGAWDGLATTMLNMSAPMLAVWALIDFLPGEIWQPLCQGFSPGPYAFRTIVFTAEAASKANGLMAGWRATQAFSACSALKLATPLVFLSCSFFGAVRGAVSIWVRTADQFARGGKLRQQGLLAAYSEFQRYFVVSAFTLWCYISTTCSDGLERDSPLRMVAEANPVKIAVLAAHRGACEIVLSSDPLRIGWVEKRICTEDPIESMQAATLLSCLAYLAVVYLSKAHPKRSARKATGQTAAAKESKSD